SPMRGRAEVDFFTLRSAYVTNGWFQYNFTIAASPFSVNEYLAVVLMYLDSVVEIGTNSLSSWTPLPSGTAPAALPTPIRFKNQTQSPEPKPYVVNLFLRSTN